MKEQDNNKAQFIRWLNGELTPDEAEAFEKNDLYKKYKAIVDQVDTWSVPTLDEEATFQRLLSKREKTKTITWYKTTAFKIAATISLVALAIIYIITSTSSIVTYKTQMAETKDIVLPDGSKVSLGAMSSLSFDKDKWNESRKLDLKGSAFFDVTEGKRFEVNFGLGVAIAHGTSFEIKSIDHYASIVCYDGEVSVESGGKSSRLRRGQGVRLYDSGGMKRFETGNTKWSKNMEHFYSAPLHVVFKSLQAQFDITIDAEVVDRNRTFTGVYTKADVDAALKMVCNPMNISFKKNGKLVTLE